MARARHMAALSTPQDQRPEKSLPDIAVVEYAYHRLRSRLQDPSLAEALRTAALSGIDVKVMISARPSGNRLPDWAGNTYIEEIVAAGVRVFLYEKGYLHAKTISIDGAICSIGSANIDIGASVSITSLNAVFYSDRIAQELETRFARDLAHCREFDPVAYRNRGGVSRFRDSVSRVLSPLL